MNQSRIMTALALAVIVLLLITGSMYSVDERQKAIVIRLGEIIRADDPPGLHFKMPFAFMGYDTVRFFDSRILTMDAEPQPFLTLEKKNVVVDSYVKWRIINVRQYYLSLGGDELRARDRLSQVINSRMRDEFGKRNIQDVISGDRGKIMQILSENADKSAAEFGIEVVDVRIQRVDFPTDISHSVFNRMKAERARVANELRAQGAEIAEKIRAGADREREVLLAEAYRDAERLRGEGDARASAIYANAFRADPEFYALYRSLNAYKESFSGKDDVMVLDPSAAFFKYFKNPGR
jgi:membrane protease subunit HflC